MELSEQLQAKIVEIFGGVQHGRITFFLSPEKKTLDYSVETTWKIPLDELFINKEKCLTKDSA